MEIGSKNSYPANALSNFAGHRFEFDGVQCNSMEGLLQSFKFKEPEIQKQICLLVGFGAKRRGYNKNWWTTQTLFWQGVEYKRESTEYHKLLTRAYDALFTAESFRKALRAANNAVFTHNIGKTKKSETILTRQEFVYQLNRLRNNLN